MTKTKEVGDCESDLRRYRGLVTSLLAMWLLWSAPERAVVSHGKSFQTQREAA